MTRDILEQIVGWEGPIVIEGVEGAGNELLAASIHYNSIRRDKLFVIQDCSTLHNGVLSAMLFGHERDSLASIIPDKRGLLDIADGGTLFLDGVSGSMSEGLQAKLLRVLKNGTFYKEGSSERKKVNVRIIVATNESLKKQVEQGLFRRLNMLHIKISSLRVKDENVISLPNYFLESFAKGNDEAGKKLKHDKIEILSNYN